MRNPCKRERCSDNVIAFRGGCASYKWIQEAKITALASRPCRLAWQRVRNRDRGRTCAWSPGGPSVLDGMNRALPSRRADCTGSAGL